MDQKTVYSLQRSELLGVAYYGLRVEDAAGRIAEYPYISTVQQTVERLINRIAPADISMLHMNDVVVDYLQELFFEALQRNGLSAHAF